MAARISANLSGAIGLVATAELATVEEPLNPQRRLEVVRLYRQAKIDDCARAELMRLFTQFPRDESVLASILDMFREQRHIPALLRLVKSVETMSGGMPLTLRLALARGLTALAQFEKAAEQYAKLLLSEEGGGLVAEYVADFIRDHSDLIVLTSALMQIQLSDPGRVVSPLLKYAVFRAFVEGDRSEALAQLERVPLEEISEPDIVFDIAVQSFRLGGWDWAIKAGDRTMHLCPDHESVGRLLVSACSFAGRLHEARHHLISLPQQAPPLRVGQELLATLLEFAEEGTSDAPRCAVLTPATNDSEPGCVFPYDIDVSCDEASDRLDSDPCAMSASVIGPTWKSIGPWEVLAEVDFVRPHLMVQHAGTQAILHAFVAANGSMCWGWEEVPMAVHESIAQENRRCRWLAPSRVCLHPSQPQPSALWRRAEKELRSIRLPEKGARE